MSPTMTGIPVCVILYFYPATCGPQGHGSGSSCLQIAFFLAPVSALSVIVGPPNGDSGLRQERVNRYRAASAAGQYMITHTLRVSYFETTRV